MMKVKITKDKEFIKDYQIERVKADAKEFREAFTEKDLYIAFKEATSLNCMNPEIIKTEVMAFDAGTAYDEETAFEVDMILDDYDIIYKIHFFCNNSLDIRMESCFGHKMYQIRTFKETK